jgi:hypothetical protein
LKALLAPLFAAFDALLGAVGSDVRWHHPTTARGHLSTSLGRVEHDCLIAGGALGGDVALLLKHVPEEVSMFALSWALRAVLRQCARATLVSLG